MKRALLLLLLVIILITSALVMAAPNVITTSWSTIDGGGTVPELSGDAYTLQGTTGQADAGLLSNGRYALHGGYWNPTMTTYTIYLPTILNP